MSKSKANAPKSNAGPNDSAGVEATTISPAVMKRPNLAGAQSIVTIKVPVAALDHNMEKNRSLVRARNIYQEFPVHRSYICHYSPYFDAAFKETYVEGKTQALRFEESDAEIFGIFVNWLYSQEIVDPDGAMPAIPCLIYLWLLGERVLCPSLQNQTMDLLNTPPNAGRTGKHARQAFHYLYENTNGDSALRRYLVHRCASSPSGVVMPGAYPHQLLVDIVNCMKVGGEWRAVGNSGRLSVEAIKFYHVAENGDAGHRSKRKRTH